MPWQSKPKKDAATCDIFGEVVSNLWPGGFRMGQPICLKNICPLSVVLSETGYRVKWNISVTRGKETKGFKYFYPHTKILVRGCTKWAKFDSHFVSQIFAYLEVRRKNRTTKNIFSLIPLVVASERGRVQTNFVFSDRRVIARLFQVWFKAYRRCKD